MSFFLHSIYGKWHGWDPVNWFHQTSLVAVITPTYRAKSVRNHCVIEVLVEFLRCQFGPPRWRRGSGMDFGSDDPGSISGLPSSCVGPLVAGGKIRLRTSQCPCRVKLGMLKTPSCPWRWVRGSRSKFGKWTNVLSPYSWNIAECDVKPQSINQSINAMSVCIFEFSVSLRAFVIGFII